MAWAAIRLLPSDPLYPAPADGQLDALVSSAWLIFSPQAVVLGQDVGDVHAFTLCKNLAITR
jgi:hypothetical protein